MRELTPFYRGCLLTSALVSIPALVHAAVFGESTPYLAYFYLVYGALILAALLVLRPSGLMRGAGWATVFCSLLLTAISFYAVRSSQLAQRVADRVEQSAG